MLLIQLTIANVKMIVRNRQALFWAMAFPLVMVVIFGLIAQDRVSNTTIAVVDYAQDDISGQLIQNLADVEFFNMDVRQDEEAARQEVADDDLNFLMIIPQGLASKAGQTPPVEIALVYDDTNQTSGVILGAVSRFLDQMNLDIAGAPTLLVLAPEGILTEEFSFIDFILPGIAVWGIMSFSVIGVATSIANYREKKILRRILATPLKVRTFFIAQVLAYLGLALIQAGLILGLGALVYDVPVSGNILVIGLFILLGNLVFLNLGFIVGAYSKSVQAASGLGNLVVLPMLMFSGVFFPPDVLPGVLTSVVGFLPLAPMVEAVRGVTLEAKGFTDFPLEIGIMALWIALTSLVAIKVFRFQ
ncbi:MAG: ABC transporter permease [SAR202 cluster bacterium]|jgi:ABC-2 type transport system permease protein|nr:ABC transporter permease [SAR202 cluster bacterium]MDP6514400.1 ABC transporter permease [SAR202 cluster bacterium]MDP6713890.1 ABC transporter permease [SAR202 cluster bacterium]